jgi:ABC-type oligopeptide transport system substrate-binding subunit
MDNNPSHRVQAVQGGDADLALEIGSADLAPLRVRFASQLRFDTQPDTSFLSFNVQRPPFSNALSRRAMNLAIDRSAVARRLSGPGLLLSRYVGHFTLDADGLPQIDQLWVR